MPDKLAVALKEWSLACDLLSKGEQTVLIRKGGIWEPGGRFTLRCDQFLLYPTIEHQSRAMLNERYSNMVLPDPATARKEVSITSWSQVVQWQHLNSVEEVLAIHPEHPWSESFADMRFSFNPYEPVTALFLRVWNLPKPTVVPMRPEFGGCRSWIDVMGPFDLSGSKAALDETELQNRISSARNRIAECGHSFSSAH